MTYNYIQTIRNNDIKVFEICIQLAKFSYCIIILYDEILDIDNRRFQIQFQDRMPWYIDLERFSRVEGSVEINDNIFELLKSKDKLTQILGIELFKQTINYE